MFVLTLSQKKLYGRTYMMASNLSFCGQTSYSRQTED